MTEYKIGKDARCAVIGYGSWATALVKVLAENEARVGWYVRNPEVLESLRTRYGVVAAWLLSSLFFGVIHLQPQLVVNAFFVGLILAYIYIRTDSLWPAMILHAVNNGVAYLMMTLGCGSFLLSDLVPDRTVYTILYVVSAAVCAASGVMVWRTLRELGRREKKRDEA